MTLAKVGRTLGLFGLGDDLDWLVSEVVSAPIDGAAIKADLRRLGWRQLDLAAATGVHRSTVSRALRGSSPQPETLDRSVRPWTGGARSSWPYEVSSADRV